MPTLYSRWRSLSALLPAAFALSAALSAAPAQTIGDLRAIARLSRADACRNPQVEFDGVVAHTRPAHGDFFVQDNGLGLYVEDPDKTPVTPGDRVTIRGTTVCYTLPYVRASRVVRTGHGPVPVAVPASFDDLIQGRRNAVLVRLKALVRSADLDAANRGATLHLQTDGGVMDARISNTDGRPLSSLLDADVELTGIAGTLLDGKEQRVGAVIYLNSLADIRVLRKASTDPWMLPTTPMDSVMAFYHVHNLSRRVRVHGVVTYIQPGQVAILQDGSRSLWINTDIRNSLSVGENADAIGFPRVVNGFLQLAQAEVRSTGGKTAIPPAAFDWAALSSGKHLYDLVSTEGTVVMQVGGTLQDEYVLSTGGHLFSAVFHHASSSPVTPDPLRKLPNGARVRVTGICIQDVANPGSANTPFDIYLRSPADIEILKSPSLLTIRNMVLAVMVLALLLVAVIVRFWHIEHTVRRQMAMLAYSERRRSRILEEISGSTPLAEIVEQTAELVSFRMKGVPCWIQIAGGACLGSKPSNSTGLRVHTLDIPSHSGPALGQISAAFDHASQPETIEIEVLSMAAGLVTLAVETRKAYSDLVRRSEIDLLTDVQNRFAFERSVDIQIKLARQSAGIFGIIYIDLNDFKSVNDLYGHRVGDLYLQEAALRMKRQLRPSDLLARIGGDEFAVLVRDVANRSQVDEIALRLEHCFDTPFQSANTSVRGSAALGIAMYPQDARTRDGLVGVADTAMYDNKHACPHRAISSSKAS